MRTLQKVCARCFLTAAVFVCRPGGALWAQEADSVPVKDSSAKVTSNKQSTDSTTVKADSLTKQSGRLVLYAEMAGNGGFFGSLNMEIVFWNKLTFRFGGLVVPTLFTSFVGMANYLIPIYTAHHLEIGAGYYSIDIPSVKGNETTHLTGVLGYRYQPKSQGPVLRISFTPFASFSNGFKIYPWFGFGGGYAF